MKTNLELLNSFREADGLAPYKDWRKARHQAQLEAYMAAAEAECPVDAFEAPAEEIENQTTRKAVKSIKEAAAEQDFGNDEIAEVAATEKVPSYKEFARYDRSAIEHPVAFVHQFLANHGDKLTRKQAVHALVTGYGVNYSTARTQYQKWFANKAGK